VPLLLRAVRKNRWYQDKSLTWLAAGEIQADSLGDLITRGNTLSVWQIEDDESNLEQVMVALTANRDNVANLDYALFDVDLISAIDIKIEPNAGDSLYETANSWHRDLTELTVAKLVKLAEAIFLKAKIVRVPEKKVLDLIKESVKLGHIDKANLKEGIQRKI
jgi:hypothetical protein